MSFFPKMLCTVICLLFYKEAVDSTLCHFFHYCNVALFFMLCGSGFLTKYSSVRYSEGKKQVKCRAWGQERVHISLIAGVCFSHFFMCFAAELALVLISLIRISRYSHEKNKKVIK